MAKDFTIGLGEAQAHRPSGTRGFNLEPTKQKKEESIPKVKYNSTQGKKGQKLPRINLFLSEEIHIWLSSESRYRGVHMSQLVNTVLIWYMKSPNGRLFTESITTTVKEDLTWHVNFGVDPEVYNWVKPAAKKNGSSMSAFVDTILKSYKSSPEGHKEPTWR